MKQVTLNTYKFNELAKRVQSRLIEENRYQYASNYDWVSDLIEDFKHNLSASNLEINEVHSIVSHSQGDGCAIVTGCVDFDIINIDKLLSILAQYGQNFNKDSLKRLQFWGVSCNFSNDSNHYAHNSYAHDLYSESLSKIQDEVICEGQVYAFTAQLFQEFENTLVELANTLSSIIYQILSNESLYLTSDEYIRELLIDMDYDYLQNGTEI